MANTILYARVSTDEQAAKGTSIPYQKERLEQYCSVTGYTVIKYFAEDFSAKNFEDRPEFNKILAFIKANKGLVQKLLVVRWDRFSRNAPEAYNMIARLSKAGIEVNAIEQPIDFFIPEQKMMLSFYLTIPEVENDRRAINTTNGIRKNKRQGRWLGVAPIGYKNTRDGQNKPIIVKTEQALLVKKAFELFVTGTYPIDNLRKQMQREGLPLSRNQFWRMLRNEVYCGQIRLKAYRNETEEIIEGIHEPVISQALFYQVQEVREGKKKTKVKLSKVRGEFPMRGYLVCSQCGGNLTASRSKGRNGLYNYYHCQNGCKERVSADIIHRSFSEWLEKISMPQEVAKLYIDVMENIFKNNETDREGEIVRITQEIKQKEEMLDKAAKKLINDELDKDDYKRIKESLQKEIATQKIRIAELRETESNYMEYLKYGVTLLGNLNQSYTETTLEGKQKLLGSIFAEKLIFTKNTYRTAAPNEVLNLLCTINKAFGESKKGKLVKKRDFSLQVALMLEVSTPKLIDFIVIDGKI